MTDLKEIILNNPEAGDSILATVAKEAKMSKDEDMLKRLAAHPGAGPKTQRVLNW